MLRVHFSDLKLTLLPFHHYTCGIYLSFVMDFLS